MIKTIVVALWAAVVALSPSIGAQQPASNPSIKRTLLQKVDVPRSPNMETVTGIAEIVPNANIGRHTHPGAETGYIIEGTLTVLVEGQPPLALKTGDSYQIPVNAIHDAKSGEAA